MIPVTEKQQHNHDGQPKQNLDKMEIIVTSHPGEGDDKAQGGRARAFLANLWTDVWTDQWTVHWYLPSSMALQYALGIVFALGHHFYYVSLNTTAVARSQWPLRFGTAMAFITQRCFVGAALVAYKQYAWVINFFPFPFPLSSCASCRL